jgi:peptidoglycan/LPS O-acetylase OafA/YrhL
MRRIVFVVCGLLLVAVAFIAAAQVADTREGLVAEILTLFAGLGGVGLLLYGLVPKRNDAPVRQIAKPPRAQPSRRTANDLLAGTAGIVVALVLIGGIAFSAGWTWAAMGAVLLLPMVAGSVYLVIAFARASDRDWSLDLRRLFRPGE